MQRIFFLSLMFTAILRPASDVCAQTSARKVHDKAPIVVGYLPHYRMDKWSADRIGPVTDLVYFGIDVPPDGRLLKSPVDSGTLQALANIKVTSGCRLLLCVGGWKKSQGFATVSSDEEKRQRFVSGLLSFCRRNNFDGVDFDWEHPDGAAELAAYTKLLVDAKRSFRPHGLLVTVAQAGWQDLGKDAYAAVDRVHLMSYDHEFPQATFEKSVADVERLLKAGCPAKKMAFGLPSYGRNRTRVSKTYAELSNIRGFDPSVSVYDGYAFNGRNLIERKVRYARERKLAGVMIWELGQDSTDKRKSLLGAIADARATPATPDVLPPLPDGAFTVVVIPDTQHYLGPGTKIEACGRTMFPGMQQHSHIVAHEKVSKGQPTDKVTNVYLRNHVEWIWANKTTQNIVFVSHVGDIVEINRAEEWAVAKRHFDRLRGVVPFGLTVGNHDMDRNGDACLFQKAFSAKSFRGYDWYHGCYSHDRDDQHVSANNVNSAQLFSASGIDFIFLHLECNASDDVLGWASNVLKKHSDRRALISTHMDLGIIDKPKNPEGYIHDPKGRMRWIKIHPKRGNTAEQLWDKLYRKHSNIGFVFSGDQSRVTAMRMAAVGDHGNKVHSLLSDYMSRGALRLVRFIPKQNRVHVITFDTTLNQLVESMPYVPDRDQHQFSIEYDLSPKERR